MYNVKKRSKMSTKNCCKAVSAHVMYKLYNNENNLILYIEFLFSGHMVKREHTF